MTTEQAIELRALTEFLAVMKLSATLGIAIDQLQQRIDKLRAQ